MPVLALRHASDSTGNFSMVLNFWLLASGIYIWEFFTTLHYEWSVIRGHQRYRWSIWIYSVSRLCCLAIVINCIINFSLTSEINCQAWVTIGWTISAVGCYGLSSILIMLRIFAIWDRNKVIIAISATIWVINLGFQLAGIVKIRAVWVPSTNSCAMTNVETCRGFYITLLATDVILLSIMLAGLIRLRLRSRAFLDIAAILWKQGVIWLLIATAAELPQVLLLYMDVNEAYNFLFLLPASITIVIAATRTYRALTYYASTPQSSSGPIGSNSNTSNLAKSNRLPVVSSTAKGSPIHIPPNRLEVAVHRAYDEYPMSQMNNCGSYPSSDTQLADKPPHELCLDDNVEGGDEKK
ncbi:hypothetical protein F5888DRAFT_880217 [Russula emetica]|nr:hypothetical protein F5888DRAFT_880217 [Russula emetica]